MTDPLKREFWQNAVETHPVELLMGVSLLCPPIAAVIASLYLNAAYEGFKIIVQDNRRKRFVPSL